MSSLLSIFLNPRPNPHGATALGETTASLGQVTKEQSKSFAQTYDQALPQVPQHHGHVTALLKQLQSLAQTQPQLQLQLQQGTDTTLSVGTKDVPYIKELKNPALLSRVLEEIHLDQREDTSEEILLSFVDADGVLDFEKLLFALSPTLTYADQHSEADPHEPIAVRNQGNVIGESALPVAGLIHGLSGVQGIQSSAALSLQGSRVQQTEGDLTLATVKHTSEISGNTLGSTVVLPKHPEVGSSYSQSSIGKLVDPEVIPQTLAQGATLKNESLPLKTDNVLSGNTSTPIPKAPSSGLPQADTFSIADTQARQQSSLSNVLPSLARPDQRQVNSTPPPTAVQPEGRGGFIRPELANQISGQTLPGGLSQLKEGVRAGNEQQRAVPADLLGETGLLGKGDRAQSMVETSLKSLSVDPSGGQGLGNGMSQFSHSQSGYQQFSMYPNQGVGLRALEERSQEFPVPALQRLQMDVQLTENQRVQIDVGVQHRQVYAGLIVDHSVLRNLANQFVPQLENQLNQVDLELQEFSTEVRDEREQQTHQMFDKSQDQTTERSGRGSRSEVVLTQNPLGLSEEASLHFVA